MADFNYYYIHKEGFSLYSGLAVGGSLNQTKMTDISNTQNVNSNTTINISNSGVYFLRFSNESGTAVKRVIVK